MSRRSGEEQVKNSCVYGVTEQLRIPNIPELRILHILFTIYIIIKEI